MEAAGLIEKIETALQFVTHFTLSSFRPDPCLRFNFEDIQKLPPPIIVVASSYSGKKKTISMIFFSVLSKPFFPCLSSLSLSHLASNSSI
jgi:hypothetical protein